jgi:hypothetical protein
MHASDRAKLRTALEELREFAAYYASTAALLERLGLGRFAPSFARQAISVDVLPLLTSDHLENLLGISRSKDRAMLLRAFAAAGPDTLAAAVTPFTASSSSAAFSSIAPPPQASYPQHQGASGSAAAPAPDNRSIEELLSFIVGEPSAAAASKPALKAKGSRDTAAGKKKGTRVAAHIGTSDSRKPATPKPAATSSKTSSAQATGSPGSRPSLLASRPVSSPAPAACAVDAVKPAPLPHAPHRSESQPGPAAPLLLALDEEGIPGEGAEDDQDSALDAEVEAFRQRLAEAAQPRGPRLKLPAM